MPTGMNMDKSGQRPDGTLPDNWTWEVFKVVDGGNGLIALYNTVHKRFVRMPTGTHMDKSGERPDGTLPENWTWEVFKIVESKPAPKSLIGKTIALYNPTHKRFVRMPTGALMDKSGARPDGTLPSGWIWEMFKVVDAGNGLIALYNPTHKRFVRMPTGTNMDKSGVRADGKLPNGWIWEKFKIVEIGNGMIALYNPTHKRFVRM